MCFLFKTYFLSLWNFVFFFVTSGLLASLPKIWLTTRLSRKTAQLVLKNCQILTYVSLNLKSSRSLVCFVLFCLCVFFYLPLAANCVGDEWGFPNTVVMIKCGREANHLWWVYCDIIWYYTVQAEQCFTRVLIGYSNSEYPYLFTSDKKNGFPRLGTVVDINRAPSWLSKYRPLFTTTSLNNCFTGF